MKDVNYLIDTLSTYSKYDGSRDNISNEIKNLLKSNGTDYSKLIEAIDLYINKKVCLAVNSIIDEYNSDLVKLLKRLENNQDRILSKINNL